MRAFALLVAICALVGAVWPSHAQTLPSEARGSAMSQIVMLSVNDRGCAGGIIVGYDEKSIYIATAAHVLPAPSAAQTSKAATSFFGVAAPRYGSFLPKLSVKDDLAVIVVGRDAVLDKYLDGLNFAILPPSKAMVANRPVTSIGCWGGTKWASGSDESLLSAESMLRVHSDATEGQSGGGLFSDAWELIGMPLTQGVEDMSARPIFAILDDLRAWNLPVLLRTRNARDRVMGAEELAQRALRRDLSQRLAAQSRDTSAKAPVRALLLGVEAVNQSRANGFPTAAARDALAEGLEGISGVGISGHRDTIERSAFSADERFLATASEDGLIRIWSLASRVSPTAVKMLQAPTHASPDFMAFDAQSRRFVSIIYERERQGGEVTIWPLGTPDPTPHHIQSSLGTSEGVTAAAASRDHGILAIAGEGRILLYTLSGNDPSHQIRALSIPEGLKVTNVTFSRDGKVLLAGGTGARVLIWDLASNSDVPVAVLFTQHKQLGTFGDIPDLDLLDLSDDHTLLMTGSTKWTLESSFADPAIKLWALKSLKPTGLVTSLNPSTDETNKALEDAFLADGGRTLVTTTLAGKISRWDLTGAEIAKVPGTSFKLKDFAGGAGRSFDGGVFAVGYGNAVELMRTSDLKAKPSQRITLHGFDSSLRRVEMSPSGRYLFGAALGGSGRLWDLSRIDPISPAATLVATPYAEVLPLELSTTGRTAVVTRDDKLEIWNIAELDRPSLLYTTPFQTEAEGEGVCNSCNVVLSADDRWAVIRTAENAKTLDVIEIAAQSGSRRRFTISSERSMPSEDVTFSPDGRWLFADEAENVLAAYDLSLSKAKRVVLSEGRPFYSLEFSPDGKWLFLHDMRMGQRNYEEDGFLVPLASVTNQTTWTPLKGFVRGIGTLEFSPDSRWVAVAGENNNEDRESDDRKVQLLRLDGGQWRKQADFMPIEYTASGLRFSPDGRWLFTGGADVTLGDRNVSARVWNLGAPITASAGQTLPNVVWNIKQVSFSPDSKWLITASGAETYARLWRLDAGRIEFVSRLAGPVPKLNNRWDFEFRPDSKLVIVWSLDDATPFFWNLDDQAISENGVAIPNGDREIQELEFSKDGGSLIILNSGGTNTGTSGSEGAHFTLVDLDHFPAEEAYANLPVEARGSTFRYRDDLAVILSLGAQGVIVSPIDLDRELARARIAAGRNLSWEEWKKTPLRGVYRPTFSDQIVTPDVIDAVLPSIATLSTNGSKAESEQLQQSVMRWARELHDGQACNSVAWELADLGSAEAALEFAQCSLNASPWDPSFRDTHGFVLAKLGRREEAIQEFEYFLKNVEGMDRFKNAAAVRRKWIDRLKAERDPFAASSN